MSFDKVYPNRKDQRKQYYGSGKFDRTCRCHGGCSYCKNNRLHNTKKRKSISDASMEEFVKQDDEASDTIPERDLWPHINFFVDEENDEEESKD
jgi:hypothetical protein